VGQMFSYYIPNEDYDFIFSVIVDVFTESGAYGLILAMLTCAGLWITFGTAFNPSSKAVSTVGFTMIKVVQIIRCVCTSITLLVLSFVSADPSVMIFGIFIIVLNIMFCVKLTYSLDTICYSILSRFNSNAISIFAAVLLIIIGGIPLLNAQSFLVDMVPDSMSIFFSFENNFLDLSYGFSSDEFWILLYHVSLILFGVSLLLFKHSKERDIEYVVPDEEENLQEEVMQSDTADNKSETEDINNKTEIV